MQPVSCTGWRLLFKLEAYRLNFLEPRFSSKILYILDERVPHRQKRGLITLLVTVVASTLKESIEIKLFIIAKVLRAGIQAMEVTRTK